MELYGIKVKNRILIYSTDIHDFILLGEQNTLYNTDKYACSFSKLIHYWREIWNERTNGITDLQFPFGFVQVSFTQNHEEYIHRWIDEKNPFYL
jgi:hypothetical protein